MTRVPAIPHDDVPVLVVTDVGGRLARRGLLPPAEAAGRWGSARVLVFRRGPVVCEPPPDTRGLGTALTSLWSDPTFQPHR